MKFLNIKEEVNKLYRADLVSMLNGIESAKGEVFLLPKKSKLNRLHDIYKRRSVTSSNEIEGVKVSKQIENAMFEADYNPDTLEEKMLLGYNDALEYIFKVYQYQELDERFILKLHELTWERVNPTYGGEYKDHQNYIREYLPDGSSRTVFIPAKPEETKQLMGNLIWQYNDALNDPNTNKLLLIFVFVLNFLCIHPFNDGNGRVSRLLTTYLLIKNGYNVDMYYSVSYLILKSLPKYYKALEQSSIGWRDNSNNAYFFVFYMLTVLYQGYKQMNYMVQVNESKGVVTDKTLMVINNSDEPISKSDIEDILFSYKRGTIENALIELCKQDKIKLIQKGRYSLYYRVLNK